LVKELYSTMTDEQKKLACLAFDDSKRLSVNPNHALKEPIGRVYDSKQEELIERILRALSAGDDVSWKQITRGGTWDASKTFKNTGANIFGDPSKGKFAFLFTGHHLTLRCDGNFKDSVAFGGPIYYGHSPNGYAASNVFVYQTKQAMKFFDALDKAQRESAPITKDNPRDAAPAANHPAKPHGPTSN